MAEFSTRTYKVLKIHPAKKGRNGNIFIRIEFLTNDSKWLKTDICPNFRNYKNWVPVLKAGVDTVLSGLFLKRPDEVDADSSFRIIKKPEVVEEKPGPVQQSLL